MTPMNPADIVKKTGHTVKDCFKLAKKKQAEEAEKLRLDFLQPPVSSARVISADNTSKPTRDKFVYISAYINGVLTDCLCYSGCGVNLLPVEFVNPNDILPSNCTLFAAGGTPIELLGHCKVPLQLKNSFFIETDFIISPSIKEPMLGIDWLTKNAARWNFKEGTIMIQDPTSNIDETHSSHAVIGRELSVRSIHTSKSDCTELASSPVILPHFVCSIPKEVLFRVLDNVCNLAKTNCILRSMLNSFVSKLIKGNYNPKNSASPEFKSERGDFVTLILTHDAIMFKPNEKSGSHLKAIPYEHGDSNFDVVESDGFNLPTLFGEDEDFLM